MIGSREGISLGSSGLLSRKYQNFWRKYEEKKFSGKRVQLPPFNIADDCNIHKTMRLLLTIAVSYIFSINSYKNSLQSF
jgi:hypothetical protein